MKIKDRIKNSDIIQAILVNALILAAFTIIMRPYLENEADIIMQELVCGDYEAGIPSSSILFSHFLIGAILSGLIRVMPFVPWYMVMHWICCFSALSVIGTISFIRSRGYTGKFLTTGVLVYLGFECYVTPGYLKTATMLSVASVYLILHMMNMESRRKLCIVLAVITGVLASMFSFFTFVAMFIICAILSVVYLIISGAFADKKAFIRAFVTAVVTAGAIFVVAAGLYYFDRLHYFKDPSLSASIAYRLAYEKCLSYGVPYFKFRDDEIAAARDAMKRLGALDPDLVDTNERLLYMAGTKLNLTIYEIRNFIQFEPENMSHLPLIYLWGFLAYIIARYGGKKGRSAVGISSLIGIIILFMMRHYLILGYYRMYTLEIIPFIFFFMMFFGEAEYAPDIAVDEKKIKAMFAVDVAMVCYLAFFIFGDDFPVAKNTVPQTETLYIEDDSVSQEDDMPTDN
ncbi:MAG: hypothetical protein IJ641_10930 [Lachnospiraceae bacterium]|nr:hypothetical protein [Lachnospiraceae bacterium]